MGVGGEGERGEQRTGGEGMEGRRGEARGHWSATLVITTKGTRMGGEGRAVVLAELRDRAISTSLARLCMTAFHRRWRLTMSHSSLAGPTALSSSRTVLCRNKVARPAGSLGSSSSAIDRA